MEKILENGENKFKGFSEEKFRKKWFENNLFWNFKHYGNREK